MLKEELMRKAIEAEIDWRIAEALKQYDKQVGRSGNFTFNMPDDPAAKSAFQAKLRSAL